ncbi:hypothetical protein FP741_03330 [Vibrio parahaemolyticus]|nr:hypothetical protein [Vibrio parahaemolyticus]NCN17646.1 hypothetical protein [Vibrio parahaemolyticus]
MRDLLCIDDFHHFSKIGTLSSNVGFNSLIEK